MSFRHAGDIVPIAAAFPAEFSVVDCDVSAAKLKDEKPRAKQIRRLAATGPFGNMASAPFVVSVLSCDGMSSFPSWRSVDHARASWLLSPLRRPRPSCFTLRSLGLNSISMRPGVPSTGKALVQRARCGTTVRHFRLPWPDHAGRPAIPFHPILPMPCTAFPCSDGQGAKPYCFSSPWTFCRGGMVPTNRCLCGEVKTFAALPTARIKASR